MPVDDVGQSDLLFADRPTREASVRPPWATVSRGPAPTGGSTAWAVRRDPPPLSTGGPPTPYDPGTEVPNGIATTKFISSTVASVRTVHAIDKLTLRMARTPVPRIGRRQRLSCCSPTTLANSRAGGYDHWSPNTQTLTTVLFPNRPISRCLPLMCGETHLNIVSRGARHMIVLTTLFATRSREQ